MLRLSRNLVEKTANRQREEALARVGQEMGEEIERLEALQKINPTVRPEEIAHLRHQRDDFVRHIESAQIKLEVQLERKPPRLPVPPSRARSK